ncbi:hypothetical protein Taro_021915 [Colocasia esculenta]|uniref:GATA-type domain-containing protein n=1 Tax=Colocasia esculenta TaxID=4460 RepID=A0A843V094_COLES|nr:hypothetical protein [Colocasia esculenta]
MDQADEKVESFLLGFLCRQVAAAPPPTCFPDPFGSDSSGSSTSWGAAVSEEGSMSREPKCCTICRTTETPLWRGGPSGPKSLCNACGIRYGKKRRELQGVDGGEKVAKKGKRGKSGVAGVLRLLAVGKQGALLKLKQRRPWRRLGEEEEAAVLLMALSCGCLYA